MKRRVLGSRGFTAALAAFFLLLIASSLQAALSAPSASATAVSTSQIRVNWTDPNNNEAGYQVERSTTATSGFVVVTTTTRNVTTYTVSGLAANTTYYFRVKATSKSNGGSPYSNVASARTLSASPTPTPAPGSVPAAPTGLSAAPASSSSITIAWTDNSTNETAFKVERAGAAAGPWTQIGTTGASGYGDSGLAPSTTYYYRVRAYNAYGDSAYTNTAYAATSGGASVPATPASLSATSASPSQINLAWADTASNESGFKIERSTATTGWAQIGTVGANVTSYASAGLATGTLYYYRIRAYNTSGDSGYSNTANATTGTSLAGGGAHVWSKDFGGAGLSDQASPVAIATDGTGASIVVGTLQWHTDFGGGTLTSAGALDIYMAKYASNGSFQWAKRFGGTGDDRPKGVAVDSSGNVYITGMIRGTVNFGGGDLVVAASSVNGFLAKFSPTGGHLWSMKLGTGINEGSGVAVDGSGNVIYAGVFYSTSDFGGGSFTTAGGADVVLAKYSSAGSHLWSKRMGGAADDFATSVAVDRTTGEAVLTGYFSGTTNLGGSSLTSAGMTDTFLARFSSAGAHSWSRRWGSTADDRAYGVSLDSLGNAAVTGTFRGNVDFGGGAVANTGGADIFLAKYTVAGAHSWSRGFGSTLAVDCTGTGVDFDSQGNVVLTGTVGGTIDFGGGPLSGDGWANPVVAKFGPDASHRWSKRYVSATAPASHANGRAIATDGSDNVLATGDFGSSVNFGGSILSSPGGTDTYLAKLGP